MPAVSPWAYPSVCEMRGGWWRGTCQRACLVSDKLNQRQQCARDLLFNGCLPDFKSLLAVWTWAGHFIFVCLVLISLKSGELSGTSPLRSRLSYRSEIRGEHLPDGRAEAPGSCFIGCLSLLLLILLEGCTENPYSL